MKQFQEAASSSNFELVVFRDKSMIHEPALSVVKVKAAGTFSNHHKNLLCQPNIMDQKLYTQELYYEMWEKLGCHVACPIIDDQFTVYRLAASSGIPVLTKNPTLSTKQ